MVACYLARSVPKTITAKVVIKAAEGRAASGSGCPESCEVAIAPRRPNAPHSTWLAAK